MLYPEAIKAVKIAQVALLTATAYLPSTALENISSNSSIGPLPPILLK
jgi:hypothetical protein